MPKNVPSSPQATATGASTKSSALLDQTLQQCQSVELIQAAVGIAVGCLAYLRDLVPEDAFSRATYGHPSSNVYSYKGLGRNSAASESAIGAQSGPNGTRGNPEARGAGVRVSILKRGHSEEVNQLLDWIELGIFEALKKGVLAAARFSIFVDKSKPEDIAESYTFNFKYQGDLEHGTRCLSGMDMASPPGPVITLRSARDGLQMFIKHLCTMTSLFPRLPLERYLNIRLYYTDDCPPEYEPPGFKKCETNSMYFSESKDLKVVKGSIDMDTGVHKISLKVSTIDTLSRCEGDACTSKAMADDDIQMTTSNSLVRSHSLQDKVIGGSRRKPWKDISPLATSGPPDGAEQSDAMTEIQNTEYARADVAVVRELGVHPAPEQQYRNPEFTTLSRNAAVPAGVKYQSTVAHITKLTSSPAGSADVRMTLSRRKLEELATMYVGIRPGKGLGGVVIGEDPTVVRCVCGTKGKDANMFLCRFCRHLQHTHCYGFHDNDDPRISDPRVCYNCLLGDTEIQTLEELKGDCVFRRALKLVYKSGYPMSEKEFSLLLGCDDTDIGQITNRLKEEGFIVLDHKKRLPQRREPKFRVVKSQAKLNQRDVRYFDPMARVARHYDVSKSIRGLPQSMVGSINLPQVVSSNPPPTALPETEISRWSVGTTQKSKAAFSSSSTLGGAEIPGVPPVNSVRKDSDAMEEDTSNDLEPPAPTNLGQLASPRRSRRLMNQNRKDNNSRDSLEEEKGATSKRKSTESNSSSVKRFRISENNKLLDISLFEVTTS
ncbi:MAG: DNA binding protein [Geoglossum umbratile]|nr:MAG: DNA binding protein [Geoglossum umbratile]